MTTVTRSAQLRAMTAAVEAAQTEVSRSSLAGELLVLVAPRPRVWAAPLAMEARRHTAVDVVDLADAVPALGLDEHLELSGPHPASAAIYPEDDGAGWAVELLRMQGQVARERRATTREALLAVIRVAAAWVMGADADELM